MWWKKFKTQDASNNQLKVERFLQAIIFAYFTNFEDTLIFCRRFKKFCSVNKRRFNWSLRRHKTVTSQWKSLEDTVNLILYFRSILAADYMDIFNPGWNFNSLNRVEISPRLNIKLLLKMTLQLHVKISTRYTELKFQLGIPSWNFNPGWKSPYNQLLSLTPSSV